MIINSSNFIIHSNALISFFKKIIAYTIHHISFLLIISISWNNSHKWNGNKIEPMHFANKLFFLDSLISLKHSFSCIQLILCSPNQFLLFLLDHKAKRSQKNSWRTGELRPRFPGKPPKIIRTPPPPRTHHHLVYPISGLTRVKSTLRKTFSAYYVTLTGRQQTRATGSRNSCIIIIQRYGRP